MVQHPLEWKFGGYTEIQNPKRYAIINRLELAGLLGIKDDVQLLESHWKWTAEILKNGSNSRDTQWMESIAVGNKEFVLNTKTELGVAAIDRKTS